MAPPRNLSPGFNNSNAVCIATASVSKIIRLRNSTPSGKRPSVGRSVAAYLAEGTQRVAKLHAAMVVLAAADFPRAFGHTSPATVNQIPFAHALAGVHRALTTHAGAFTPARTSSLGASFHKPPSLVGEIYFRPAVRANG